MHKKNMQSVIKNANAKAKDGNRIVTRSYYIHLYIRG